MNADISTRDATNSNLIAGNGNVVNRSTFIFLKDTPEDTQELIDEPNPYPNPYRGLEAFREEHASNFFGRDEVILKLQEIVHKQPFVALIGASGSGKSSLVFAGLVPKLRNSEQWMIADFRPRKQPFNELALSLIPLLYTDKIQQAAKLTKLADGFHTGHIGLSHIVQLIKKEYQGRRLLLIADQFEELYTNTDKSLQNRFADTLIHALSDDMTLLLTMRADFMSQASSNALFVNALNNYPPTFLAPMSEAELRDVIEKPAEKCGVKLESGLTKLILEKLENEPGSLPLLEFALTQLWEKQSFRQMTHEAYQEIGGVTQALARHADAVYAGFTTEEQIRVRQIFVQLVHPGQGTEDTRQVATFEQVKEENRNLIAKLADKRLVVTGRNEETGQETIEVVHEALIRNWQPLKQWMNEDREFRVWQERLRIDLKEWKEGKGSLLAGAKLSNAKEWLKKKQTDLTDTEQNFIQHSLKVKKLKLFSGAFVVITILSVFAFLWLNAENQRRFAYKQKIQADEQRNKAQIKEAEALSQSSYALFLSKEKDLEALIASVKAGKAMKQLELPEVLKEQMIHNLQEELYGIREKNRFASSVNSICFSPDGKTLASGDKNNTIRLWNISEGKEVGKLEGHKNEVLSVHFSPDGKMLTSGSKDRTVKLWDMQTGQEITTFKGHTDSAWNVSFSPDGKMIASGSLDNTARLWGISDKKEIARFRHDTKVVSVNFSPDGKILASGSEDGIIRLWDTQIYQEITTLKGHMKYALSVHFSSDGKTLASSSEDNTIRLWNMMNYQEIAMLKGHTESVFSVHFSPDGKTLASGSFDNTIRLWNVLDGKEVAVLRGHTNLVYSAIFSPDGKMIASCSGDNTIRLWKVYTGTEISKFKGHTHIVNSVNFSPDGKTLASGSFDNTVKVWNTQTYQEISTFKGHTRSVNSVSFSPDGKTIASGSLDNTIRLWNISDRKEIGKIGGHRNYVLSVDFSPDGKTLASGSHDETVKLWNVQNGQRIDSFTAHTDGVNSVHFSPDGKTLASGSEDYTVRLWNISDGKEIAVLKGHGSPIYRVKFSPDGKMLASCSGVDGNPDWDNTIRLWNVETGKEITTIKKPTPVLNVFLGVSFSPDGKTLSSGRQDNTIQLWNVKTGKEITVIQNENKRNLQK